MEVCSASLLSSVIKTVLSFLSRPVCDVNIANDLRVPVAWSVSLISVGGFAVGVFVIASMIYLFYQFNIQTVSVGEFQVPSSVIKATLLLFLISLVYGILVRRSVLAPMVLWTGVIETGALIFVVYLFYRLVMSLETIADNLESG